MNVSFDRRPSAELTTNEVMVFLVQAIRAREIKTAKELHVVYAELFPDMPADRWPVHASALARSLS